MFGNTKNIVYYLSIVVILFIIYTLAHAHYEVWLRAEPIHYIGAKTTNLSLIEVKQLYTQYTVYEHIKAIVVSIGISLSTMLIIIYYDNKLIKLLFVLLDGLIMYLFLGYDYAFWWKYGSYIYGIYIFLIVFFVGSIAREYLVQQGEKQKNENANELIDIRLAELDSKVATINGYIEKIEDKQTIDKKIAARKQYLRRNNIDWREDEEIMLLQGQKDNL